MTPGELRTGILALDPFFEHAEGRRANRAKVAGASNPQAADVGRQFAMANKKPMTPGSGRVGAGTGGERDGRR